MSFLGGSVVKKLPANARDSGSIPGSGRSPGERNGNRLQGSCLGNPTDRVSSRATVHMVEKRWTWPSTQGHTHRGVYGGDKVDLWVTLHVCVQEIYKVSEFIHFRQRPSHCTWATGCQPTACDLSQVACWPAAAVCALERKGQPRLLPTSIRGRGLPQTDLVLFLLGQPSQPSLHMWLFPLFQASPSPTEASPISKASDPLNWYLGMESRRLD